MVDEVVDLGFEGLDIGGGGVELLGEEASVDERFDFLLLLFNQLRTYLPHSPAVSPIRDYRDVTPGTLSIS